MTSRFDYEDAMIVMQRGKPSDKLQTACNIVITDYTTGGSGSSRPTGDELWAVNSAADTIRQATTA